MCFSNVCMAIVSIVIAMCVLALYVWLEMTIVNCYVVNIMHLSMSSPTYPRSGRGGDCWGFANARMQIPHPWGQL